MRPKRWIFLALFLGAALLSAWLSPALSSSGSKAATGGAEAALAGVMNSRTLLQRGEALIVKAAGTQGVPKVEAAGPDAALVVAIQAAMNLPLLEEDTQIYLPVVKR